MIRGTGVGMKVLTSVLGLVCFDSPISTRNGHSDSLLSLPRSEEEGSGSSEVWKMSAVTHPKMEAAF